MKSRSHWLTLSHSCFALHYRLAPTLLYAVFAIWLCTSADALKLRYSGAEGRECVSEQIAVPKSYVTGSFVSLPGAGIPGLIGGRASYNLEVLNPQGRVIHSAADKTEAKFSFKARFAGQYQFCLSLSEHLGVLLKHGPRDVLWEVYAGHSIARLRGASRSEPLWNLLDAVGSDLADMKSLQQHFHNQEIRTQATLLSISGRSMGWAVLRCLALLAVAMYQISFIRRLFDRPKRSIRV